LGELDARVAEGGDHLPGVDGHPGPQVGRDTIEVQVVRAEAARMLQLQVSTLDLGRIAYDALDCAVARRKHRQPDVVAEVDSAVSVAAIPISVVLTASVGAEATLLRRRQIAERAGKRMGPASL